MRTEVKADRGEVASVGLTSTYREDLGRAAVAINADELDVVVNVVTQTLLAGRGVILAGNGGSATTSQHIANDWTKATHGGPAAGPVISLASNVAALTAIANDYSFDEVFARQLPPLAKCTSLFIALSVSGQSPNLICAVREAKRLGLKTIALIGRRGYLADLADLSIAYGPDYGLTEDLHLSFGHVVVRNLRGGRAHLSA